MLPFAKKPRPLVSPFDQPQNPLPPAHINQLFGDVTEMNSLEFNLSLKVTNRQSVYKE